MQAAISSDNQDNIKGNKKDNIILNFCIIVFAYQMKRQNLEHWKIIEFQFINCFGFLNFLTSLRLDQKGVKLAAWDILIPLKLSFEYVNNFHLFCREPGAKSDTILTLFRNFLENLLENFANLKHICQEAKNFSNR